MSEDDTARAELRRRGEFMPSEALITRPHDAAYDRLVPGQRVLVTIANWHAAAMRVTDVITHADGDETYVLLDSRMTDEQIEERKRAQAAFFSSLAMCGNCRPAEDAPGG